MEGEQRFVSAIGGAVMDTQHARPINLKQLKADSETVELLFQTILGRPIGNDEYKKGLGGWESVHYWVHRLLNSEEFRTRYIRKHQLFQDGAEFIPNERYRTPAICPLAMPSRVLVTGSCMTNSWKSNIERAFPNVEVLHQLFNNASELEDLPEVELRKASFQIVQISLRSVMGEIDYFSAPLSDSEKSDLVDTFDQSVSRLRRNLNAALKYNRAVGLPVFVLNFATPQVNPLGFLLPKDNLSSPTFYIQELNRALNRLVAEEKSVYVMDWEELTGTFGKRFIQDDGITTLNHGSFMGDMHSPKETYLTPMGSLDRLYHRRGADIVLAIFNECVAMHNVLSSDNKIKLVIFDLDNTLWSGVAAEMNDVEPGMAEGWPIGILEAAAFLKKRGILLGLASKNDPDVAIKAWDAIYGRRFPLANFVSTKFSWESKATSVAKILTETNLLPSNALFVDDNPIEREQVQKALPEIKVLEGPVYTWRRTLLWAAELQVPFVSSESAQRTASVRSSINRETLRLELDEERYLRDLAVTIKFDLIDNTKHLKFARAHELLNKTNQFNTTGRRWSEQDMAEFFADGGKVLTADVADRLSNYGLTALILMRSMNCVQMVMSCRVFGLRVEFALLAEFLALGHGQRLISFRSTGKNALCKKFFHHVKLSLPEGDVSSDTVEITLAADYQLPSGLADTVHIGI